MRHVTGLVLAVVLAAALFAGAGWGSHRIDALRSGGTSLASAPGGLALAALVVTGLLLGALLVAPAVSPLAVAARFGLVGQAVSACLRPLASDSSHLLAVAARFGGTGGSACLAHLRAISSSSQSVVAEPSSTRPRRGVAPEV